MTEAQLFEKIGRLQTANDKLNQEYDLLLSKLGGVVSGEIARTRVLVNLTDRTWEVAPEGNSPGLPASVNGLPVCVVAPPLPPSRTVELRDLNGNPVTVVGSEFSVLTTDHPAKETESN